MCHHEDGNGPADEAVTHFYLPCMPVGDTGPHDGQAQLSIIGVVQFPAKTNPVESRPQS